MKKTDFILDEFGRVIIKDEKWISTIAGGSSAGLLPELDEDKKSNQYCGHVWACADIACSKDKKDKPKGE